MTTNIKVAFIGCGNMGGALALAASKGGFELMLADYCTEKAEELAEKTGGTVASNAQCAEQADYIFIAVKPQVIAATLGDIAPILKDRIKPFVLVSMAAGVDIASICNYAGGEYPVIRIMPNTPASVGEGVILFCHNDVKQADVDMFQSIMRNAGMLDWLPEKQIDAASALSGCGPAFVYQFIEALADGAVDCGLPRDKALAYAEQTVAGAAILARESGIHPGQLKDAVCSPGGSTIEGVRALEAGGMRSAVMEAVIAAYNRTKQLGK